MRQLIFVLAIASQLGGCVGLPGTRSAGDTTELLKAANEHIETCERHYQGGLGVGAAFTFRIDCPAVTHTPSPDASKRPASGDDREKDGAAGQD
jgi:hypothetical protein